MNNNNMGRVAVRTSSRKRSATPIPYDVNSTFGVGAIKPLMIREVVPNSSISVKTRNLIRLATMNVPTYGRLKLNLRHYFVGMSDLTKNFGALMSEQVISRAHGSFKPISLPRMTKGFLNLFSLVGAHVTLYRLYNSNNDTNDASQARLFKCAYKVPITDQPSDLKAFWTAQAYQGAPPSDDNAGYNNGDFYKQSMPSDWREVWNGYDGPALNICKLMYGNTNFGNTSLGWEFWIPIENKDWTTFFDVKETDTSIPPYYNSSVVPLDKADAVLSIRQRGSALSNGVGQLACRFSNFGIRWRDLLIMSGTGIDYNDWNPSGFTSLMPIFAYYKAYWESFGLELYKKWETSAVVKMMCVYDDQNEFDFEYLVSRTSHKLLDSSIDLGIVPSSFFIYWCNFVCDVGTAFYTEEKDFTSIHNRDAIVSPNDNVSSSDLANGKPNYPTSGLKVTNYSKVSESTGVPTSPDAMPTVLTENNRFTQLDIETLKRMYKVVNRNTIAGQNIAKLLELQGLGAYVESCKSRFVGEYDVPIDIDEVTATADAFDADGSPRSLLGAQGAKGVGFGASKRFKVSTNEFGYFIVLSAIVPESGYINLVSSSARNLRKTQFYNPEFDGLGMELNTKELTVTGEQDWSDAQANSHLAGSSFGYAPQYSRHKVQCNYALSGMSLRSERDYFRSYFLDKCIDVGERSVKQISDENTYTEYSVVKTFTVDKTPIASPNWQFVGRYPWIENYLRIFAETGDPLRKLPHYYASLVGFTSNLFDFTVRDADKFIVQSRFIAELSSPWLKITDAFETKEDGNVGSTDVSIGKA